MIAQSDIEKLNKYRGQAWVTVFKRIDESEHIKALRQSLLAIKATGKLTIRDLAIAYNTFGLQGIPGRTYFRFIEGPVIKHGTYDMILDSGGRWSDYLAQVAAEQV